MNKRQRKKTYKNHVMTIANDGRKFKSEKDKNLWISKTVNSWKSNILDLWILKNNAKEYRINTEFCKLGFTTFEEFLDWNKEDSLNGKLINFEEYLLEFHNLTSNDIFSDSDIHNLYSKYYDYKFDILEERYLDLILDIGYHVNG